MELFIITGTTKGLGLSLSNEALKNNYQVISISRKKTIGHPHFHHISQDLSKPAGLEKKLDRLLLKLNLKNIKALHLINNAAVIDPIGNITEASLDQINSHVQVNLVAPLFLTSLVIKKFKHLKCYQTFTTISSGAALRPIGGWSLYCSTKAAMRMLTECLELDYLEGKKYRFLDFSPGVMDTEMQVTIRKQSAKNFKRVSEFKKLKENKQLLSPDRVATALLEILSHPATITKKHYDVNEGL